MAIIVQKFGGTSLQSHEGREAAAHWVVKARAQGDSPVVVVSAMGREGDPYATDTLLKLVQSDRTIPAYETDLLMSCGEVISAVVMAGYLRIRGLTPRVLTGGEAGIRTDERFGDAEILKVVPHPILTATEHGMVPVVAGFQGETQDGRVTTLGRGGSDTSAVAIGAAIGAEVVEIFTDVDGIKTADPRIVPDARTILQMDYEEVFQLANLGARVLHPRAVELARQFSVRLRVRSTFSHSMGTLVAAGRQSFDPWAHRHPDHAVTGVTHLERLVQIVVESNDPQDTQWAYPVFQALGESGVSVDLINIFPNRAYFCVPDEKSQVATDTLERRGYRYQCHHDRAKVSIVGSAIQGLPGVMGRVMGALARQQVEVLQSSDSHSTITLLLHRKDMEKAVQALHVQFGLSVLADGQQSNPEEVAQ